MEDLVADRTALWERYSAAELAVQQRYTDAEAADPPIDPEPYLWRYQRTVTEDGDTWSVGPWEPVDPAAPAWSIETWRGANTFASEDAAR